MTDKFLSAIFILAWATCLSASAQNNTSAFDDPSLGKCYPDVRDFVREALGEQALTDSNIKTTNKGAWTWVVDQTASTNYTWFLLEKQNARVCVHVYVPSASSVEFKTHDSLSFIDATIASLPLLPGKLIEFQSDPATHVFKPARCFLLPSTKGGKPLKRQPIDCEKVME